MYVNIQIVKLCFILSDHSTSCVSFMFLFMITSNNSRNNPFIVMLKPFLEVILFEISRIVLQVQVISAKRMEKKKYGKSNYHVLRLVTICTNE